MKWVGLFFLILFASSFYRILADIIMGASCEIIR